MKTTKNLLTILTILFTIILQNSQVNTQRSPLLNPKNSKNISAKTPQPWANQWYSKFSEKIYFPIKGTKTTQGNWWYDFPNKKFRNDRSDGYLDHYCGTIYWLSHTKCTHLVTNEKRYLYFPEKKYCCTCCTSEQGCGVVRPNWVSSNPSLEDLGVDESQKIRAHQYKIHGMQNNLYWESEVNDPKYPHNGKPYRQNQEPDSDMIWDLESYKEGSVDPSIFDLPKNMGDCDKNCPLLSFCGLIRHMP